MENVKSSVPLVNIQKQQKKVFCFYQAITNFIRLTGSNHAGANKKKSRFCLVGPVQMQKYVVS